ncbi:MAG TPA: hypothetical protein PKE64_03295 [Anaerolineae bacterium]|nr:hypothetical protein [Anaerolineae bacterium]HMR63014.1 hypothetical protein [Anaerolineae bacterium]
MTRSLIVFGLLILFFLIGLRPLLAATSSALPLEGQTYTVQADDKLARLTEKYFSDPAATGVLIAATNLKAGEDERYTTIDSPAQLTVGQQLFIPNDRQAFEATYHLEPSPAQQQLLADLDVLGRPPELNNEVWLNSDPLKLADLQGQVVIVEFWTYG